MAQNIYYFIWVQFYLLQFYYFVLHYKWANFHNEYAKDALLHTFAIFVVVSKQIEICFRGTGCFLAETLPYLLHTQL